MYRDANLFEHPETFNPERFLTSESGIKEGADDTGLRYDLVFGFGRVSRTIYRTLARGNNIFLPAHLSGNGARSEFTGASLDPKYCYYTQVKTFFLNRKSTR